MKIKNKRDFDMARKYTASVGLTKAQKAELDELAKTNKVARSVMIEKLMRFYKESHPQ